MPPHRNNNEGDVTTDLMDSDISFPLARLFDRFNLDHIPDKHRMDEFEHRDLAHIKHYKAAVNIFGGPLSRKRVLIAPPMETLTKHRLGLYMDQKPVPAAATLNTEIKIKTPYEKPEPVEIVIARQAKEREDNYKSWFKERQKFRNDLENMGLNSEWLAKKPNKTVLEKRVLRQLKDAENKTQTQEEDSKSASVDKFSTEESFSSEESSIPNLRTPAPLGLKILDQHLKEKKLRLIDLFTSTDKNKDWKITREEFMKILEEKNIPLSRGLLEDMLISLDMNLDDMLDYKEMAYGMELARREKREDRRKELSRETTAVSQKSALSDSNKSAKQDQNNNNPPSAVSPKARDAKIAKLPENNENTSHSLPKSKKTSDKYDNTQSMAPSMVKSSQKSGQGPNHNSFGEGPDVKLGQSKHVKSGQLQGQGDEGLRSSSKAGSPALLEPPYPDTREERLVLKTEEEMVDLRKRDREGLKGYNSKLEGIPAIIRSGSKAIDNHSMQSTLDGDLAPMVDKFRQKRLQEYFAIKQLCQQNEVVLSEKLLERVLLYPPDKPHSSLKKVRAPDSAPLITSTFAHPPKRPHTPIEVKHKDKVRRSKSGKLLIDSRHKYPPSKKVSADAYKQTLSTGRAVIRRKVDCWMTFEEYEHLTRKLAVRYHHLHGTSGHNAFWPGHLLDKLRLCMPPYDRPHVRDREAAIFTRNHRTPAVNYGYEPNDVWKTNSDMHTQIGIHDHFKNKTLI